MTATLQLPQIRQLPQTKVTPDWSREQPKSWFDPGPKLLHSLRRYQYWRQNLGWLGRLFSKYHVMRWRFWSVVSGAHLPLNSQIEGGLLLLHPNGVVIDPRCYIGANCLILQQVTITQNVVIGHSVEIGAGAKIIRPVKIGNRAKIGANAVVLCDVPDGATAVGVPAKIIDRAIAAETEQEFLL